ncbi:MAG: hypothetical protein L6R19_27905 [Alphaproteobacteria bacterium]|nr:hypothetical protein [Alphaproteobacteria bacterium]
MMESFLQNLAMSATLGAGMAMAAVAVACLGLWLLGMADGGNGPTAGIKSEPYMSSAMR